MILILITNMSKYQIIKEIYNTNPFNYNDFIQCEKDKCFNCPHCSYHYYMNVLEHVEIDEVPVRCANFEVDIYKREKNKILSVKLYIDPYNYESLKYQNSDYDRISHNYIKLGEYSIIENSNHKSSSEDINKFVYNCFITLFIHLVPQLKFCLLTNDFKFNTKNCQKRFNLLKNTHKLSSLLGDNIKTLNKYAECPVCFEVTSTRTKKCNHNICVKCFYKMYDTQQVVKCPCCRTVIYDHDEIDDYDE